MTYNDLANEAVERMHSGESFRMAVWNILREHGVYPGKQGWKHFRQITDELQRRSAIARRNARARRSGQLSFL